MKIIVFGATGGTGKLIVSQALAKGHSVTAFVRNPEGLTPDPHLRVIQGDLFDLATVVDAVRGHRAVLSALGARSRQKADILANALPVMLEAMRQEYVTRLIVLGASGVQRDHGKYQNALTNMAIWVAKNTVLKHPFVDQTAQERLLVLHRVVPRHVNQVAAVGLQARVVLRESLVRGRAVTIDLDAVLDDFDAAPGEPVRPAQAVRAEAATRGYRVRQAVEVWRFDPREPCPIALLALHHPQRVPALIVGIDE